MATGWNGVSSALTVGSPVAPITRVVGASASLAAIAKESRAKNTSSGMAAAANKNVDKPLEYDESEGQSVYVPDIYQESGTKNRAGNTKYRSIYTKYFSASDFVIKMKTEDSAPVWLDKAAGIAISESLTSTPIYTLGNSRVNFFSRGNLVVSGFISVNMVSDDYIARIMSVINGKTQFFKYLTAREQMGLTAEQLKKYLDEKEKYEKAKVEKMSTLGFADYPLFTIELEYNNSDAITSSGSFSRVISGCRIIGYEQGVDIGGDGQLTDGYKFIAREIV